MIGPTDLLHPSPAPHLKTFHTFLIYYQTTPFHKTEEDVVSVVYLKEIIRITCIYAYFSSEPDFGMQ
jgi:hypothetical protein